MGATALGWIIAGVVLARPGVVVTRDGSKYQGDVTEKTDSVVVTIHDVDTTLQKTNIDSITYTDSFDQQYKDRMAKLDPKDAGGRVEIARWALEQGQYAKAREAADSAQQIDPNNSDAADLQTLINSQERLDSAKAAPNTTPDATPAPPTLVGAIDRRFLTLSDINVIRQDELQPIDKMTVRFDNNVDRRFVQYDNLNFNQFNALKPVDKALMIFDKGDVSMRPDVKVLGDPLPIRFYRQSIEPVILNGCAASSCHGTARGGNFELFNPAKDEQTSYTNFYILTQYSRKVNVDGGGRFASPVRHMIDRGHGIQSLLAQYALPAKLAEQSHPKVEGYDGIFKSLQDPRLKQLRDWEDINLKRIAPDYGIQYQLPGEATTQPTSQP